MTLINVSGAGQFMAAIQSARAGDTLLLAPGNYGAVRLDGNASPNLKFAGGVQRRHRLGGHQPQLREHRLHRHPGRHQRRPGDDHPVAGHHRQQRHLRRPPGRRHPERPAGQRLERHPDLELGARRLLLRRRLPDRRQPAPAQQRRAQHGSRRPAAGAGHQHADPGQPAARHGRHHGRRSPRHDPVLDHRDQRPLGQRHDPRQRPRRRRRPVDPVAVHLQRGGLAVRRRSRDVLPEPAHREQPDRGHPPARHHRRRDQRPDDPRQHRGQGPDQPLFHARPRAEDQRRPGLGRGDDRRQHHPRHHRHPAGLDRHRQPDRAARLRARRRARARARPDDHADADASPEPGAGAGPAPPATTRWSAPPARTRCAAWPATTGCSAPAGGTS